MCCRSKGRGWCICFLLCSLCSWCLCMKMWLKVCVDQRRRRSGAAGLEGCLAPASWSKWTTVHQDNQQVFFQIPLSVLVLNTTCEMEQETMSPLGSPSHLQKFPHAAWRANGWGLEDQSLYNIVLKTVLWNQHGQSLARQGVLAMAGQWESCLIACAASQPSPSAQKPCVRLSRIQKFPRNEHGMATPI